jgi:hypothetical protein
MDERRVVGRWALRTHPDRGTLRGFESTPSFRGALACRASTRRSRTASPPRADTTPAAGRCPGTETGTERCPVSSPPDRHNGTAVAKFHGERAILRPAGEVASSREGSDGEKGLGSFEEEGELQARARARGAVRSLHVHVPAARAWRLQVGQGADPGVRDLRRVQAPAAILTRATSLWGAKTRSAYKLDVS